MKRHQDFRLNKMIFKEMINKKFLKYRCDEFLYTNSVTGVVGIYIEDKIYELRNEQKGIDYFNYYDDFAVWSIKETDDNNIKSFFLDTEQINTPINEYIKEISLVNENQKATIDNVEYDVWITRAIIFHLETRDVYFMKDSTAFSEEIEIKRGNDLLKEFPKYNNFFMDEWNDDIKHEIKNEIVHIKI